MGAQQHHEIYDIINKNLLALKDVDSVIDNDIKNEIMSFNPEQNEELRSRILSSKSSFMPSREKKFEKLIEGFIKN